MNIQISSRLPIIRLLITLFGILALTSSPVLGAVPDQVSEPVSLVRLNLQSASDLERIPAPGLPIYTQLQTVRGDSYLLLPATPELEARLTSLGFQLKVLDKKVGAAAGSSYYLLYAHSPEALQQAGRSVTILEQEGLRALVKAAPANAERLSASGLEIVRLKLHPFIPPSETVTVPEQIEPDPVIQEMIDQVDLDTVYNYDAGLSGEFPVMIGVENYTILTRFTGNPTPIEKATRFTYEHFQSLGLPVIYDTYPHPSYGQRRNVIAEQAGVSQPERIFMVTAHLDDTSGNPYNIAPGADDNASGSVGVLIAADILSNYDFDCTIRYALFTGEEQGLYGSYYYAQDAFNNGDDIQGVLNLDMIASNSDLDPQVELHTRPSNQSDLAIANLFDDVVDAYNLSLSPVIVQDGIQASDHASFWDFDYPAVLGIEDFQDFTPYYHTTGDQVETLNMGYFTQFVKAAVGTTTHMGCLLKGSSNGRVTNSDTSDPIPGAKVISERSNRVNLSTQTDGDGNYLLSLATGVYTVTAQADGYVPFLTSGVQITTNVTTTLDIQLQPCSILGPDFTFSPPDPQSGHPITFSGVVNPSSTGSVTFGWNFGDGHRDSGQVVTHTYTVSDTYSVSMSATNCAGTVSASHPVTVTGMPGISVSIQSLDVEIPSGETLTRTLEIGSSGEQTLAWSLTEEPEAPWLEASSTSDDLAPQERQEIILTLQAPLESGIYTTTLQVQSNGPHQPGIEIPITLTVPCSAASGLDFTFSPEFPKIGETVGFSGGVITGTLPITYTWDFQDGSVPVVLLNDAFVEHVFPTAPAVQSYPVSLEAANACSAALLAEHLVTVYPIQLFLPLVGAEAR